MPQLVYDPAVLKTAKQIAYEPSGLAGFLSFVEDPVARFYIITFHMPGTQDIEIYLNLKSGTPRLSQIVSQLHNSTFSKTNCPKAHNKFVVLLLWWWWCEDQKLHI